MSRDIEGSAELEGKELAEAALREHIPVMEDPLYLVRFRTDLGRFKADELYFIPKSSFMKESLLFEDGFKTYNHYLNIPEKYQGLDLITYVDIIEERKPEIKKLHAKMLGTDTKEGKGELFSVGKFAKFTATRFDEAKHKRGGNVENVGQFSEMGGSSKVEDTTNEKEKKRKKNLGRET